MPSERTNLHRGRLREEGLVKVEAWVSRDAHAKLKQRASASKRNESLGKLCSRILEESA